MYIINKQVKMKIANISQKRFSDLARLEELIFQLDDLARIWGINNRNNLRVTLKRYVDSDLLFRLYRGLYALKKPDELEPIVLGTKAINNYCYLSAETVLAQKGVIFQKINYFTFISAQTKRFQIAKFKYYSRQLQAKFLYNDTGVENTGKVRVASLERAVADILYFNPHYHFDNPGAINWRAVKKIQQAVGYKIS